MRRARSEARPSAVARAAYPADPRGARRCSARRHRSRRRAGSRWESGRRCRRGAPVGSGPCLPYEHPSSHCLEPSEGGAVESILFLPLGFSRVRGCPSAVVPSSRSAHTRPEDGTTSYPGRLQYVTCIVHTMLGILCTAWNSLYFSVWLPWIRVLQFC